MDGLHSTKTMDGEVYSAAVDEETYFNMVYDNTYSDVLKYVIIKTSNADQVGDIIQNAYYKFYTRILKKGFDDITSPKAFVIKIASRELSKHYKRKAAKLQMEADLDEFENLVDADETELSKIVENKVTLDTVGEMVLKLPLLSYKSFVLFYYYDLSIACIARHLNISESNVKNRLWRSRNEIRKGLKSD